MCDMTHTYVWHDSFTCVWRNSFTCVWRESCAYVWHDERMRAWLHAEILTPAVTWLSHMCVWRDSFTCVTWLIYMFGMTHAYVWHDLFTCVWHDDRVCVAFYSDFDTWCDITQSHVWRDSYLRVTRLMPTCDMIHLHVCDIMIGCVQLSTMTLTPAVTWLSHKCDVTHSHVWHDSCLRVTRLIHRSVKSWYGVATISGIN